MIFIPNLIAIKGIEWSSFLEQEISAIANREDHLYNNEAIASGGIVVGEIETIAMEADQLKGLEIRPVQAERIRAYMAKRVKV